MTTAIAGDCGFTIAPLTPSADGYLMRMLANVEGMPLAWEDDIVSVVEELGPDVVIGGSDFPHGEGLADPVQLAEHLTGLDAATQKPIMRDNGMALVGLA